MALDLFNVDTNSKKRRYDGQPDEESPDSSYTGKQESYSSHQEGYSSQQEGYSSKQESYSAKQEGYSVPTENTKPSPRSPRASECDVANADGRRKRKSRWGDEDKKINIPGVPTALPKLSRDQADTYVCKLEEINRKLRTGDFIPPERERSPSPEPIYNADGKRVNTREARYRKKLEDERHRLIENALKSIPGFKPPVDYKRPSRLQEKVYIPAKEFPEINFIGLLIGPRGNTLKGMESDSGAKISIRGRGSVKEGKSRTDAASSSAPEEDLHCLVMADTEDKVKKAVKLIEKIIETSASTPEGQNELKRNQLRELAALNGTLRDDENQTCLNCGAIGHRRYECPERQNLTVSLTCRICNGHGHTARDCLQRNNPEYLEQARERNQQLDSEYMNLMAELGENIPEGQGRDPYDDRRRPYGGERGGAPWQKSPASAAPPWQRESSSAPWTKTGGASTEGASGAAPWNSRNQSTGGHSYYRSQYEGQQQMDMYGYDAYGYGAYGYGAYGYDAQAAGSTPWTQTHTNDTWVPPPPPPPSEPAPPPPPSAPAPPPPPPQE
ncbi:hypothetical protein BDF14DRAFT_1941840 [Spinellus fusiger]|nr:hypothetical protein BDF14DRAFT_1941840 [Spinellus fusiger]